MKITCKLTNQQYVVTVNGSPYTFTSSKAAWAFAFIIYNKYGNGVA